MDALLTIDAAVTGSAQRRTTVRHRHLSDGPLVIVAYRLTGEAAAPLGVMFGTSVDDPTLLVAPEPRSIGIRFRDVMNPFGAWLCDWLDGYVNDRRTIPVGRGNRRRFVEVCVDAPQIIVPNRATVGFVGSVLGRSLRYLRTEGEGAVPEETVLAGQHLTWLQQRADVPGSCVLLAATDLLRRHYATGQSDLEDEDLHVLLSWIDPPSGKTGAEMAAEMELLRHDGRVPAAGPTPDADWDRDVLDPLLEAFNEQRAGSNDQDVVERLGVDIRHVVEEALTQPWNATWRALEILRAIEPGSSVADRWQADVSAWKYHADRVLENRAFFKIKDTAKQSAWMISDREKALAALDAGEALDDPLVLAGLVAAGQALLGEVTDVDRDNEEQGPSRMVKRPLIELDLDEPAPMPIGSELYWTKRAGKLRAEIVGIEAEVVTLKVTAGMRGELPEVGDQAAFANLTLESIPPPRQPQDIPWTHIGADTPSADSEVPE